MPAILLLFWMVVIHRNKSSAALLPISMYDVVLDGISVMNIDIFRPTNDHEGKFMKY